jgi:GNAT superfamily N-acetyltransferase
VREIRPIRDTEAVSFLRLLCDVFGVDFSRARSIFFNEPMFDLNRKWALFEDGEMRSILTTVPLTFGWGKAIGVAGVATVPEFRGQGLAAELLQGVLQVSAHRGEGPCALFATDPRLYSSLGFEIVDESVLIPLPSVVFKEAPMVDVVEVERIYAEWSQASLGRLRRDRQRWKFWKWNLRMCWECGEGYLCAEGDTVREVITQAPISEWPTLSNGQFLGLRSIAEGLGLPMEKAVRQGHLMVRDFPMRPEFFLTDQF